MSESVFAYSCVSEHSEHFLIIPYNNKQKLSIWKTLNRGFYDSLNDKKNFFIWYIIYNSTDLIDRKLIEKL